MAGWEPMWGKDNMVDAALSNGASILSKDGKTVEINSDAWVEVWDSFRSWIHDDKTMKILPRFDIGSIDPCIFECLIS